MTELGPIPVDWAVKRLGDFCSKIGSGSTPTGGSAVYLSHGTSFIRSQNVYNGYFKRQGLAYISELEASLLDGVTVFEDDVLLNITGDSVARCTTVPSDVLPARVSQHVAIIRVVKDHINPLYLQCYLTSPSMQSFMLNVATGQGGSRNALTKGMVADFQIPLPPLAEQRRIAGALSDVDELISALGKLIEKKRNIKTGSMQQLLTGKTRLPGFGAKHAEFKHTELGPIPKDWEVKRLGTVGESIRGVSFRPEQSSLMLMPNATMLLRANNIQNNKICCQDVVYVMNECISDCQQLIEGDILICAANGSRNLVGKAAVWRKAESSTFGAFMAVFRCVKGVDSCFVGYLFQSQCYRRQLDDILTGSAINNLNAKDIEGLAFAFPPLAEQKAIAAALSDMDAEIAALEADRAKYERIKSGMMQELLTGKTRLKGE